MCISENYVSSSLCTKEVRLAKEIGKVIVPLVLPETEHKENMWDKIVAYVDYIFCYFEICFYF